MDKARLEKRRSAIMAMLADRAPYTTVDQKHLDADTPEKAYWHLGYASALADVMRMGDEPNTKDPQAL